MGGFHCDNAFQQARLKAGITQEQASEALDCGTRTLQRYETGERLPKLEIVLKMMKHYGCEFSELFPQELIDSLIMEDENGR